MAIIKTTTKLDQWLEDFYDSGSLGISFASATGIAVQDVNGAAILINGKDLVRDGDAVTGTITKMTFKDSSGSTLMTVSGLALKANNIFGILSESGNIFEMMSFATAGNDTITGTAGSDDLMIGRNFGNDTIYGMGGDDYIKGSQGNNTMDGGTEWDTVSYSETYYDHSSFQGITLNATKGTVTNSWGGTDTIKNFEEYEGSRFADTLVGSKRGEVFKGLGGKDKIDGGAGIDEVRYDRDAQYLGGKAGVTVDLNVATSGVSTGWASATDGFGRIDYLKNIENVRGSNSNDAFIGDGNNNILDGRGGDDKLSGGLGNDMIDGGDGADQMDGGGGTEDTLIFWKSSTGGDVMVDLHFFAVYDDGFGNTDSAFGFENIESGSGNDDLWLGTASGYIDAGDGNDILRAGGTYRQSFTGGNGVDTFYFLPASITSILGTEFHSIEDFTPGEDKIELNSFKWTSPDFIGSGNFTGVRGQVRTVALTDKTQVQIDSNGDFGIDYMIILNGVLTLGDSDFLFT